jgi:hypothetical protein
MKRLALPLLLLATQAAAQSWTQLTPAPYPNTSQRRAGGIAFDPIQGKLLMYGGLQSSPSLNLGDTWTFDGATWTQLTPATTPPVRWGHHMVFDTRRACIVTFGGRSPGATQDASDTWEWTGVDWRQVLTANAPRPRSFYGLAYDERRGRTVLFGGQLGGFIPTGGNETWEYNGVDWTRATPAYVMPGLESPAMAYDSGRGVVVMFGGWDGNVSIDHRETWEYDGVDWVLRPTANAPLSGYRAGIAYDQDRGRLVLYGGYSGSVQQNVWEYDGNDWTNVLPGVGPGRITEGYMAWSPMLHQTLYFGGSGPTVTGTVNNETWLYTGNATAVAAKFGHGCATSAGVPDLTPTTTPRLGNSYVLTASNGTFGGIGLIAHGFSNLTSSFGPLPVDLGVVGLTGCRLEVSPDATLLMVFGGGIATQTVNVPTNPALSNTKLFSQVLVIDANTPNGNGGLSNAVHAVLGS